MTSKMDAVLGPRFFNVQKPFEGILILLPTCEEERGSHERIAPHLDRI